MSLSYHGGSRGSSSFYTDVALGKIPGYSYISKFGFGTVAQNIVPITQTLAYPTPTAATALEILSSSGDDDDDVAKPGARKVTVIGLDANWEEQTEEVSMDGVTPVALANSYTRIYRWFVSESGTYATATAGSHVGTLTIRESGGGTIWTQIDATPFPVGQSEIGAYTIPAGKTGYLTTKHVTVDSNKSVDLYFFARRMADDVADPYTGIMRIVDREVGVTGPVTTDYKIPKGPFVGPCDIGFMGVVSANTADVSVEFELLLVDNA